MESKLIIHGQDGEIVAIKIFGRSHPGADNYHDANWLDVTISIEASAFGAIYNAYLYTTEFPRFLEGIIQIKKSIPKEADSLRY